MPCRAVVAVRCGAVVQGGELGADDLDKFFRNTWSALRKHDPLLGQRQLQDQQRQPEQVLLLLQQMSRAHQQLQQQLPVLLQRQLQVQQRQQGTSEGQDGNGQGASTLQAMQKQLHPDAAANGESWPAAAHPLLAQQLQQQQQQYWLLQHSLGSMLLEAATQTGMTLEALLKSTMDKQVAVLLKYLALPQGSSAAAAVQRLQRAMSIMALPQQQQQQLLRQQQQQQPGQQTQQQQQQLASEGSIQAASSNQPSNEQQQQGQQESAADSGTGSKSSQQPAEEAAE